MGSDWLGYRFRNKSDWFGINFNTKLLPGISLFLVILNFRNLGKKAFKLLLTLNLTNLKFRVSEKFQNVSIQVQPKSLYLKHPKIF